MFTTEIGTDINKAIHWLNSNETVAIPTETVYGLAANALNTNAVAKIFQAKNRPHFNPLIIHLPSVESISNYAIVDELSYKLAKELMPGAFTLLLPKKNNVPDMVTAGSNKVAVRVPNHTRAMELLSKINFPLAAPSANQFGYVSPVSAEHVYNGLQGKIPYILDGGNCNVGLESTIVEVLNEDVVLHRVGGVSIEKIEAVIGKKTIQPFLQNTPQTSGQLKSHYATKTPLLQGNVNELIQKFLNKRIAIISFSTIYQNVDIQHQYLLSSSNNCLEAAQNLFTIMRNLDEKKYDIIIAEIFPNKDLGIAINDRLQKAQFVNK